MARFTILVAALLFIAVTASAYKTTITTVEIDEDISPSWRHGQGKCTQKLQSVNLKQCERYISEQCREQDVIAMRGIRRNPRRQDLEHCCAQLRELNDQKCQCQALQRIMQKQSEEMQKQSEELEGREIQEMERELKKLPEKCGMELPRCEFGRMDF